MATGLLALILPGLVSYHSIDFLSFVQDHFNGSYRPHFSNHTPMIDWGRNPFTILNACGLILTALPPSFHQVLYDEIEATLTSAELASGNADICFASYELNSYAVGNSKLSAVLAMAHSFWQHATMATLVLMPE